MELNKILFAYHSTPCTTTSRSPVEILFKRKMPSTKLPQVADFEESGEVGYQQTGDRDTEKKQIGADYVDKRHQAADKYLVLLEKEKELSPYYDKEQYQVMAHYGDQVQLKSPQGEEYKCNIQMICDSNRRAKEDGPHSSCSGTA